MRVMYLLPSVMVVLPPCLFILHLHYGPSFMKISVGYTT